jgi:phosphopantothenoylcysteine decarboxylase/phosphopantothenate--cysteine ligase
VTQAGAGFDVETNVVQILDTTGAVETLPLLSKRDVADRILDRVATLVKKSEGPAGNA